jgi:hypothetical protein
MPRRGLFLARAHCPEVIENERRMAMDSAYNLLRPAYAEGGKERTVRTRGKLCKPGEQLMIDGSEWPLLYYYLKRREKWKADACRKETQ